MDKRLRGDRAGVNFGFFSMQQDGTPATIARANVGVTNNSKKLYIKHVLFKF